MTPFLCVLINTALIKIKIYFIIIIRNSMLKKIKLIAKFARSITVTAVLTVLYNFPYD